MTAATATLSPALEIPTMVTGGTRRFARLGFIAAAISFGGFGGWAALAPLDSAAIAPGQVAVDGSRKPLQHLEGGIIREIMVKEAERVAEGQVLFRLEPTQARGNADLLRKQLDAVTALETRLLAEQDGRAQVLYPAALLARRNIAETGAALADQERQFAERRRSIEGQGRILKARIEQTSRDITGRRAHVNSLATQIASLQSEVNKLRPVAERGFYPVNKLHALERELARLKGDHGVAEAEAARGLETIEEARLQIAQVQQKFQEEVAQQLGEARAKLSDIREKLSIAEDVLTRVEVRAPKAGIVQNIKVYSAGSVVKPGETIGELVPTGDALILTAKVSPLDIDSIKKGQRADIRFPSFSSRQAGPITGTVESVSADSLIDEVTKQPYFAARVAVDLKTLPASLVERVVPGLPADVMIATGERTMLRYIVGPLMDTLTKAGREK